MPFYRASSDTTINLGDYCVADGSDQSAGVQAALNAAAGGTLLVPAGTYTYGTTAQVRTGTRVLLAGRAAVLAYTGTGSAVRFGNVKNVEWAGGTVDLSRAGADAVGLHLAGAWLADLTAPRVVQGGVNSTGILVETSSAGGNEWGSYCIRINSADLRGVGAYGLRTLQTVGDTVRVTHLYVEGGWFAAQRAGIDLNAVEDGRVVDTTLEGAGTGSGDGIRLTGCSYVTLNPGEIVGYPGWGVSFGTGNSRIMLLAPTRTSPGGALGFLDPANYEPSVHDYERVKLFGSGVDQTYSVELSSRFDYGEAVRLSARGSQGAVSLLSWGQDNGLGLSGGSGGVIVSRAAERVGFYGTPPVARPALTYSRTGESAAEAQLRAALVALGLVTDSTTA